MNKKKEVQIENYKKKILENENDKIQGLMLDFCLLDLETHKSLGWKNWVFLGNYLAFPTI